MPEAGSKENNPHIPSPSQSCTLLMRELDAGYFIKNPNQHTYARDALDSELTMEKWGDASATVILGRQERPGFRMKFPLFVFQKREMKKATHLARRVSADIRRGDMSMIWAAGRHRGLNNIMVTIPGTKVFDKFESFKFK